MGNFTSFGLATFSFSLEFIKKRSQRSFFAFKQLGITVNHRNPEIAEIRTEPNWDFRQLLLSEILIQPIWMLSRY